MRKYLNQNLFGPILNKHTVIDFLQYIHKSLINSRSILSCPGWGWWGGGGEPSPDDSDMQVNVRTALCMEAR